MDHDGRKPIPKESFLNRLQARFLNGNKVWRNRSGSRLYTWDYVHGHVEVFDGQGRHIASVDAISEALIGNAVKGRKIDVS